MEAFAVSTFTVAVAELGDKTQLLALLLAARFSNKLAIVAGILVATLLNHGVSAWLGGQLANFLQSDGGQLLIGLSFIALAAWLLLPDKDEAPVNRYDHYGAFLVSLILFFLVEIGDKTQVATVLLGAQYSAVLWVTLGTTLGMLLANVPVVYAGDFIMRQIPLKFTRTLAALAFATIGLYQLLKLLA